MKKKIKKILSILMMAFIFSTSFIYAADSQVAEGGSFLDKIFKQGNGFFNSGSANFDSNDNSEVGTAVKNALEESGIISAIQVVGNLVFLLVTVVLGIKYIFAESAQKADIKNSLIILSIAVIFFYLAETVFKFASGSMKTALGESPSFATFEGNIWTTVATVANVCAIAGIIMLGVKYMVSSADSKADIKTRMVPMIIGLILIYCTVNVLTFIYKAGKSGIKTSNEITIKIEQKYDG